MLDLEAARLELSNKTITQIHQETAWKWASRSCAAYILSVGLSGLDKAIKYAEAEDYAGEAKEHASQVSGDLVDLIGKSIAPHAAKALIDMAEQLHGEKNV